MEMYTLIFHDMTCEHNAEADNIIVQQLINILKESSLGVSMISDDTDDCNLTICQCIGKLATKMSTGPRSAVGNVSGNRCESDCRSRSRVRSRPGPILSWRLIMK